MPRIFACEANVLVTQRVCIMPTLDEMILQNYPRVEDHSHMILHYPLDLSSFAPGLLPVG